MKDKESIPFHGNKYLIGNGYLGVRGTMEEYKKENMPVDMNIYCILQILKFMNMSMLITH